MAVKSPATAETAPTGDAGEARDFPYWRSNILYLPLGNLLSAMGFSLSVPFVPLMLQSLGVHEHLETWSGNMMLLFYVIGFLCGPVWGGIADHYGRKIMVLRAMLGMGACMTLIPFAPSPFWFILLFALVGFFNGNAPAAQALIIGNTPPGRISSALARLQSAALSGQTIGPAIGTFIMTLIDHTHWLFWFSGALMISGGAVVGLRVREVKQLAPGRWRLDWVGSLRSLVAVPRIGTLYFLSFVFAVLANGNVTILSIYTLHLMQGTPDEGNNFWVGAVAMALAISSVAALTFWGRTLDRVEPGRVLLFATIGAAVTQVPLLFLQTPLQLVLTRIAFGLTASLMLPSIVRLLKNYAPRDMEARAISYNTSFQFIAMGLAPFFAGLIGPAFGLRTYFAITTILVLVALGLWFRIYRRDAGMA